ncbi:MULTISPECIES: hypothetical protein [unclassified Campylobacter]|uniref:hypothetical protein n=1 Tax=unclassified Campylobacter TaxID=2593542 RepID=UPI0022E9EB55|nr:MULTISPECIES: hypothetical protein [unclassified Campylobacter]MDA3055725.1 hypothetical protein [Campylobacter sp. CN_NA1]MDA3065011.1 hypothetical protein [Campylobacter sp. CN_NE4]MDA3068581.1 hypothetical protein [Campylobacter sp. CN_NE3]MDA3082096.1 hypothetical protein [Campylobacter sp. CN_EL2]MDA3084166.1 hypothetical protein [Campylobacter sp. CN_NE1]
MEDFDSFLFTGASNLIKIIEETDKHLAEDILPSDIVDIVKFHAKGATAASVASGWIPGVGGAALVVTCVGFIWSMYARINDKLGLKLSDNILKTLASGVATNIAGYAVGSVIVTGALSFIPFIGSVGASVIAGAVAYALTLVSGYVYLQIMTKIFRSGRKLNSYKTKELKDLADNVIKNENIDKMLKKAKKGYNKERNVKNAKEKVKKETLKLDKAKSNAQNSKPVKKIKKVKDKATE